jgi:segregation and condensation protein A
MRESELSQSGQAFLYASMLILLKADTLVRIETFEEDVEPDLLLEGFFPEDSSALMPLPPYLERKLRRRATTRPLQQRAVSLQELIDQLQRMAAVLEEDQNPRRRIRRPRPQSRAQAARVIILNKTGLVLRNYWLGRLNPIALERFWVSCSWLRNPSWR